MPPTSLLLGVGRAVFALALVGLGVLGLWTGDFARQWQPVPADFPARQSLAIAAAVLALAGGVGIAVTRATHAAALGLSLFFLVWALLLHGPRVVLAPGNVGLWLGLAEIFALACASFMLAGLTATGPMPRMTAERIGFGASCLVFGAAHFVYDDFTASMVPGWLPAPMAWAYATGAGHVAAGLALMSGVLARLASLALALMFTSFVVLLHLPRVVEAPTRAELTPLAIAALLCGAGWIAAAAMAGEGRVRSKSTSPPLSFPRRRESSDVTPEMLDARLRGHDNEGRP